MRSSKLLATWAPREAQRSIAHRHGQVISDGFPKARHSVPSSIPAKRLLSGTPRPSRSFLSPRENPWSPLLDNSSFRRTLLRLEASEQNRLLSTTRPLLDIQPPATAATKVDEQKPVSQEKDQDAEDHGFQLSEKAVQASQIDLSAKLGKDGLGGKKAGWREIWRLLQIARPEGRKLGVAFVLLLVSSSVTMSIPFSIGKIMDIATKGSGEGVNELFGLSVPMFYGALSGILILGAAANYGRIILLRIVGEQIVARQRSKLFRRTFIQDAEFFDANRIGDLISRLSSDTIIVGKSITQNLSDGLRATVSGVAGFSLMAFVSLKLSSILALMLPPVGLAAFFYGRAIRNLSRKIQKNLGTLTKIAEERLGNVRTSQSFAAEVVEVHRYNKQVRKIFDLGKKDSIITATFFSSVRAPLFFLVQLRDMLTDV